jgi:inosine-uridine nucleoside N-ribohydrolase
MAIIGLFDRGETTGDNRYTFYWDTGSMAKIKPGMRHHFHVHDFTYGFNTDEQQRYDTATAAYTSGDIYREQLRGICTGYVQRMARYFGLEKPEAILNSFMDLLQTNKQANKKALLVIGGPFTEALEYVRQAPVEKVVAMGGFIDGGRNLFPNQFNFHVDMASAKAFLADVTEKGIPLKLVPTECVKGSVFELDEEELQSVFTHSPMLYELAKRYCQDSGPPGSYKLFDWVAALVVKNPDLLPVKRVKAYVESAEGTEERVERMEIIKFKPDPEGPIQMCWPVKEHMAAQRTTLLEKMTL